MYNKYGVSMSLKPIVERLYACVEPRVLKCFALAIFMIASFALTIAQPFTITIVSDASNGNLKCISSENCSSPLRSAPFTNSDFIQAQNGTPLVNVSSPPSWGSSLPNYPQAKWVGLPMPNSHKSMLIAHPFYLRCRPMEGTVNLKFQWMVDDRLGDPSGGPNPAGVYINGNPISTISGGGYTSPSTVDVAIPSTYLNAGLNWLYIYVRDTRCVRSGVIYGATLTGRCFVCAPHDQCQMWNECLASVPSVTLSCSEFLAPNPQIAFDDFTAGYTGPVNTVEWWGTLSSPEQADRPYHIAFYRSGDCRPNALIYYACVKPRRARIVGYDCAGRQVWHFVAVLPQSFQQTQGTRYHLSIAEIDRLSVRPGKVDFEWSGHRQISGCAAVAIRTDAHINDVINRCDDQRMDLAWCLKYRRWIRVVIDRPLQANMSGNLRVYVNDCPDCPPVWESTLNLVSGDDGDPNLYYNLETQLPSGEYKVVVNIPGMLPITYTVTLSEDEHESIACCKTPIAGDVNGDGVIDDADLLTVLFNFGVGGGN